MHTSGRSICVTTPSNDFFCTTIFDVRKISHHHNAFSTNHPFVSLLLLFILCILQSYTDYMIIFYFHNIRGIMVKKFSSLIKQIWSIGGKSYNDLDAAAVIRRVKQSGHNYITGQYVKLVEFSF